jgi:hypothetical protein
MPSGPNSAVSAKFVLPANPGGPFGERWGPGVPSGFSGWRHREVPPRCWDGDLRSLSGDRGPGGLRASRTGSAYRPAGNGKPFGASRGTKGTGCGRPVLRDRSETANRSRQNGKPFGVGRSVMGNRRRETARPLRGTSGGTTAFPPCGNIRLSGRTGKLGGLATAELTRTFGIADGKLWHSAQPPDGVLRSVVRHLLRRRVLRGTSVGMNLRGNALVW